MLAPVIVTFDCANARPTRLEAVPVGGPSPVKVMAVPASTFPTKAVLRRSTAVPTCQYTLHALPPLAMTTEPFLGVRSEAALKIQTSFWPPFSVNWLVNSPVPLMQ